jgi:hypothetical protein
MSVNPQQPYPTVAAVMRRARAFVMDSYGPNGQGRILTNTAPFSVEYLNAALEEIQERLGNNGVITLTRDNMIVGPIPALAAPDPSQQISLGYQGLFVNGKMQSTPALPGEVVEILEVSERPYGSGLPFSRMTQRMEGLPISYVQGPWLKVWEYRGDAIWMVGSVTTEELKLRYRAAFPMIQPDVVTPTNDQWTTTTINILATTNALAKLVAYHYALARGAQGAPAMATDAEKYMRLIIRRYTRGTGQRKIIRRRPYGRTNNSLSRNAGGSLPF